ncbi:signal peptidase I [Bdellovibrio svalbardensis]|uniref:Signal peptidase I n=1 Tax=Bdellovibrio svalbardensis TaxID=2972972 RepID=A0ABT6DLF4_9BACT|nr:signal peptidase I [Bdellovibrio svalbardensis]MDG0816739.1 signal peptidase I [Bdellovibrio svalbardensis]
MDQPTPQKNLKGTWNQAILTFLFPIFLVLGVRWALYEPFVIPSGSMIPNLLVHDHILVKKFAFGLHFPFSDKWMFQWSKPERGEIVVFKYPENPDVYYIKRLIGLPGDEVVVQDGHITVNGMKWDLSPLAYTNAESGFAYYNESIDGNPHVVRFMTPEVVEGIAPKVYKVPNGHFFFMGDNRDQSSDSRYWGFVKNDYIVGKAWLIWLSCDATLPSMTFVCDPSQLRWNRFFQKLK